jgi:DNA repair exonuclease SbcCD ATPase subunit
MRTQKEQELNDLRLKYEKMIDDLKRSQMNDKEFIQKELQRKIDDLERQIKDLKDQFDKEREKLLKQQQEMKDMYEKRIQDLKNNSDGDVKKMRDDYER